MVTTEDLKKIVIMTYLKDHMLDRIISITDVLTFEDQEVIFSQGDIADRFYMVKRGKVLLEQRIAEREQDRTGAGIGGELRSQSLWTTT